jgi:hypothetical protein
LDDLVVATAAAIITATLIVLSVTLVRFRFVVSDAGKSAQLAKNLWDAMNSRLAVQDTRIIDLMAKVEVYSVRRAGSDTVPAPIASVRPERQNSVISRDATSMPRIITPVAVDQTIQETESQILRLLVNGPKTSSEIKGIITKSREHTARLMKLLYERGLVVRNDQNKPYVYEVTEAGKRYLSGA